ncbi:MAG: tRNA preQ1(34) S-adenosylmethionine ribosyltransferase-isomerase QueA [Cyanobacteria bacterium P01_F01_bin.150]
MTQQNPRNDWNDTHSTANDGGCEGLGRQRDDQLSAYDYDLPEAFIAQFPVSPRDHSRLLAIYPVRKDSTVDVATVGAEFSYDHRHFFNLPDYLKSGDLLVLNNTRVIPARLYGYKRSPSHSPPNPTPSLVEVFLLEKYEDNQWLTLVRPGKRLRPGAMIQFGPTASGHIVLGHIRSIDEQTGGRVIDFEVYGLDAAGLSDAGLDAMPQPWELLALDPSALNHSSLLLWDVLPELGSVPLPPYISNDQVDPERYQTVYGDRPGAVAAPTAGLHFTPSLLNQLDEMGVKQAFITLHVGVGTFRPVEVEDIATHQMHGEWIEVPEETVAQIQETKARGGRVIAVGTTATRALEGAAQDGLLKPFQGKTNIFIYPGYQWRVIDGLITNFHLPKSSLMMMVSALIGRKTLLALYEEAIAQQYRFYSFGDAMLLLPDNPYST